MSDDIATEIFNKKPLNMRFEVSNFEQNSWTKATLYIQFLSGLGFASIIYKEKNYCTFGAFNQKLIEFFGSDIEYTERNTVRKKIDVWINCEDLYNGK